MKFRDYITEERVELEFTTGAEEIWAQKLAKKWNRKASFSFFVDAVIIDAPEPVMRKIRMEVSNATSKLKGLYVSEYTREGTLDEGAVLDAIKEFVIVAHMSIRAAQMAGTKDNKKVKSKMVRLIDAANKIAPTFENAKERADFFKKINKDIDKGVRGPELVKRMRFHLGDLSKEKSTGKFMDDLEKQMATWKAEG